MTKIFDPNIAAQAYTNSANIATAKPAALEPGKSGGASFSDFLKKTVETSIDTLRQGESMAAKGITGTADPTDVVAAVNSADITIQTVVAIRDKMVGAYQDIMRMPI